MLVSIHLLPPRAFSSGPVNTPALVSMLDLRGARNTCTDEWPERTDYCRPIGTIVLDNEHDFLSPVAVPAQSTRPVALDCADATAVKDSTILLLACWFCIFVQFVILSERD